MPTADIKSIEHSALVGQSPDTARKHIRNGSYNHHTAGLAPGFLQGNLVILNEKHALDFFRFCQRNPKPCPLVGVSDSGNPKLFTLGADIDIRTDVPAYYVYRDGELTDTVSNISTLWQIDFVAFVIGCSFTFEHALQAVGIPLWHIDNDTTVPMFTSNIPTVTAGPFGGNTVVSMRAIPEQRLDDVIEICRKLPMAHGAPLHWGNPAEIGIDDLTVPDWGDPGPVPADSVPVFWACGVTPQNVLLDAGLPLCITHSPGHMLIADVAEDAETTILT